MRQFFTILVITIASTSCGFQGKVSRQQTGQLELPQYPNNDEIFLAADTSAAYTYKGAILIWNDGATAEQIGNVSNVSEKKKTAEANFISFMNQKYGPQNLTLVKEKDKLREINEQSSLEQTQRRVDFLATQRSTLSLNSKSWFAEQLAAIQESGEVEGLNTEDVLAKFRIYCEAKLWELATSPYLMGLRYTSRPTPSPICESIYETSFDSLTLLDRSSYECKDSPQPKSYFKCLWQEGVVKTQFFRKKYATQLSAVNQLKFLIRSGEWETITINSLERNSPQKMMKGKLRISQADRIKLKPTSVALPLLGSSRSGMKEAIKLVESAQLVSDQSKRLFAGAYSSESELPKLIDIRLAIRLLGKRDSGARIVGAADIIYNGYRAESIIEGLDIGSSDDANKRWALGQEIYQGIFGKINTDLDKESQKFVKMREEQTLETRLAEERLKPIAQKSASLDAEITDLIDPSIKAVHSTGAVNSIWSDANLKIEEINTMYRLTLRMKDSTETSPLVGCVDIASGTSLSCPESETTHINAEVSMDKESGKFVFLAVAPSDSSYGFSTVSKNLKDPGLFNLIPQKNLVDRNIRLRLYPVKISGLAFLTGDIRIDGGDLPEYNGSITLSAKNMKESALRKKYKL